MKTFFRYFLICALFIAVVAYYFGWQDLISNDKLSDSTFQNILMSFSYYFKWVLPYWWLVILLGGVVFSFIGLGLKWMLTKLRVS